MEFATGDYVHAVYKNSKFTGTIVELDERHEEARVSFSPGVDMLLPYAVLTHVTEEEIKNGTDTE